MTYRITVDGCTLQEYKTLLSLLQKYMGFDGAGSGRIHLTDEKSLEVEKAE